MKRVVCLAALSALFALTPAVANDKPETPKAINGAKVVTVSEAKQLVGTPGVVFLDTRSPVSFGKGHVPGASTASYKERSELVENFDASKDEFDLSKLPPDKNAKIVFYSDGPTGWKSYKAAVLAVKSGYKNVMYMRGGMVDWEREGHPVER